MKRNNGNKGNWKTRGFVLFFWLLAWQGAAAAVDNSIILVGPAAVLSALLSMTSGADFWLTLLHSFLRISLGFLLAFAAGSALGILAQGFAAVRELLSPVMLLLKSVPVASFVILVLIWAGSKNLSVVISFTVALPMIYENTVSGLRSAAPELLEMAGVFRMSLFRRGRYIYLPALFPYLINACRTALGMSVKSGVAAEVIGTPDLTLGERLYMSKIYLDTAGLFAWTLAIIAAAWALEKAVLAALRLTEKKLV